MADMVVVGTPGGLTAWGFQFLRSALDQILPGLQVIMLDRFDRLDPGAPEEHRLIMSAFPPPSLAEHCRAASCRPFVLMDEFIADIGFIKANHSVSTLEAVRSISASLALIGAVAAVPGSRVIGREADPTLMEVLSGVASPAGSQAGRQRIEAACQAFGGGRQSFVAAVRSWSGSGSAFSIDDEDASLAESVLGGLAQYVTGGEAAEIVWPRRAFFDGDRPGETAPAALEITGRARIIFYGPYFHLPAGDWQLRLLFGFSENLSGLSLKIQIASKSLLDEIRVLVGDSGLYAADKTIRVSDPEEPMEIRIMSEQGAIEGKIALIRATLKPAAMH